MLFQQLSNFAYVLITQTHGRYSNWILLNKCDLVSAAKVAELRAFLSRLNPAATILETSFARVQPLSQVLFTNAFDFDAVAHAPGWLQDLVGDHTSETDAYGFTSFVFRSRRPFAAGRFHAIVSGRRRPRNPRVQTDDDDHDDHDGKMARQSMVDTSSTTATTTTPATVAVEVEVASGTGGGGSGGGAAATRNDETDRGRASVFSGVLRSKGKFAVVEEPAARFIWSSSFSSRTVRRGGTATAAAVALAGQAVTAKTAPSKSFMGHSNNAVELVFIGIRMDEAGLRSTLEDALATDAEISRAAAQAKTSAQPLAHPWRHAAAEGRGTATPTAAALAEASSSWR